MTETLRDMMAARADAAPGPNVDIQGVVRNGQRRVWRHRVAVGTAACAAVAAVALVVPTLSFGEDDQSGIAESGAFETRTVTYAQGSTIHYGDETIDVSPHDPTSFVQTDDGFVYTTEDETVYFTDGGTSEAIGDNGWELRADDDGSYVGWWTPDGDQKNEAVFYDTSRQVEVMRTSLGQANCFDGDTRLISIDDGTAYTCDADRVTAWELTTQQEIETTPQRPNLILSDTANGYLAWDRDRPGSIVSRHPEATGPLVPGISVNQLSPSADYIAAWHDEPESWGTLIVDRRTGDDVTPQALDPDSFGVGQWLDDDSFLAVSDATPGNQTDLRYALSTCSISEDPCVDVTTVDGSQEGLLFPTGETSDSWW